MKMIHSDAEAGLIVCQKYSHWKSNDYRSNDIHLISQISIYNLVFQRMMLVFLLTWTFWSRAYGADF